MTNRKSTQAQANGNPQAQTKQANEADEKITTPQEPELTLPGDEFDDLSALRVSQNFAERTKVVRPLLSVPIGKPNDQSFVRVHRTIHEDLYCLDMKRQRDVSGRWVFCPLYREQS